MKIAGFQLRALTLVGSGVPNAEVRFKEGLNVVSGPSDTGKTFIVQCIDYMLGGTGAPKPIPESEHYYTIRLTLGFSESTDEVVLERSIKGGNFKLISAENETAMLLAKHSSSEKESASRYFLDLSGLGGKKVRKNKRGVTREVSFRDLARLILVDEESVISETSPIFSGNPVNATAESAVFRLLLTGIDDSSVVASEDPRILKGRQAGKIDMLDLLLKQAQDRLEKLGLPGGVKTWNEQLREIEILYEKAQKELRAEQANAETVEAKRRTELQELRRLESKSGVLRELQHRFALLEKQYRSDLRRLESITEAASRLDQMNEERCSICGALAEHHEVEHQQLESSPEDVATSCLAEARKIRSLISDLSYTIESNEKDLSRLRELSEQAAGRVKAVSEELEELLKPRIEVALRRLNESQLNRDTYRRALEFSARISELQQLRDEIGRHTGDEGPELNPVRVQADEAEEFSKEVESLLRAWHFPGLDRVTFSEGDQDIVISGRNRASHGKGVRAVAHAAFNLALMKHCLKKEMPHPGFVVIDSPLVVYREPDTSEGGFSHDVKDAFYRSMATDFRQSQVIIFENEDPPSDLYAGANLIVFTGTHSGRQGFIPTNRPGNK